MYCFNCGTELGNRRICPGCGMDVSNYRKIIHTSNNLYNEGLEKASVRDLSGAIVSLRESLRFNKENMVARNLLGLVYFEIGETVAAFSEWVISSNIQPEDNPARDYLDRIQKSQNRIENLSQTLRKYNQALTYCYQGSLDLAVIQLRKVLSLNPKYLRARQLLALLYMEQGEFGKAGRELQRCRKIDVNNTTTLRYLGEVEAQRLPESALLGASGESDEILKYKNGNETIIKPASAGRSLMPDSTSLFGALLYGLIGLVVGAAAVGFLILPVRIQSIRNQSAEEIRRISEQAEAYQGQIDQQNQKIESMEAESQIIYDQLDRKVNNSADAVLERAAALYLNSPDDTEALANAFEELAGMSADDASPAYGDLYNALYVRVQGRIRDDMFEKGRGTYMAVPPDFELAASYLEKALRYCDGSEGSHYTGILYYLPASYYHQYLSHPENVTDEILTKLARARRGLEILTQEHPESDYVSQAAAMLGEINALGFDLDSILLPGDTLRPGAAAVQTAAQSGETGTAAEGEVTENADGSSATGTEVNP